MLSSITPLGERGRSSRWSVTVTAYVVASTVAGAVLGLTLGAVAAGFSAVGPGWLPGRGVLLAVAGLAAVGALLDSGVAGLRLPTVRRQVDEDWLVRYRGWVYGAGFGAQLGVGVVTIVTSSTVYLTWAVALLSASPVVGAVLGGVFGLVRALPVLTARRVTSWPALVSASAALDRARPVASRAALACVVGTVPLALAASGTGELG